MSAPRQPRQTTAEVVEEFLSRPPIVLPAGAQPLPREFNAPSIYTIDGANRILKAAYLLKLSEAEAMRFVARMTDIPVPKVHDAYVSETGDGYIFMDRVPGRPLSKVWEHLSAEQRRPLVEQLRDIVFKLTSVHGDFYGALWNEPSVDIFLIHHPFSYEEVSDASLPYGPFNTRDEYNQGLILALRNARPEGSTYKLDVDQALTEQLMQITDETKVFSHGDFHMGNIMVDEQNLSITGIIDWEGAGFSIRGRDYFEARLRASDPAWTAALDVIFSEDERKHFELFQRFDWALTRYTLC